MEFFNQQEDVIDIQLTQYGKFLLSKGEFMPTYYAFYDDDIIYDPSYIGITEEQNRIVARITGSTPRLKTQYVYKGIETEFNRIHDLIRGPTRAAANSVVKPYVEKEFSFYEPLGISDPTVAFKPAWQVSFIEGEITGSVLPRYSIRSGRTKDHYQIQIPQINTKVIYKTSVKKLNAEEGMDQYESEQAGFKFMQPGQITDVWGVQDQYIHLEIENVIAVVLEENVTFKSKNFEIEVFEIEENLIPGANDQYEEILKPLKFLTEIDGNVEVTDSYVEYYFDLFVDDEVISEVPPSVSVNYVIPENVVEDCD